MAETTTIQVTVDTYKNLNGMKGPGDSFDDVIDGLINEREQLEAEVESLESTLELLKTTGPLQQYTGDVPVTEVLSAIDDLDLPGSDARLVDHQSTVFRAMAYIANHGGASKEEIIDAMDHERAGYPTDDALWDDLLRPSLLSLASEFDELDPR